MTRASVDTRFFSGFTAISGLSAVTGVFGLILRMPISMDDTAPAAIARRRQISALLSASGT
jgi:hypothetical protein